MTRCHTHSCALSIEIWQGMGYAPAVALSAVTLIHAYGAQTSGGNHVLVDVTRAAADAGATFSAVASTETPRTTASAGLLMLASL